MGRSRGPPHPPPPGAPTELTEPTEEAATEHILGQPLPRLIGLRGGALCIKKGPGQVPIHRQCPRIGLVFTQPVGIGGDARSKSWGPEFLVLRCRHLINCNHLSG